MILLLLQHMRNHHADGAHASTTAINTHPTVANTTSQYTWFFQAYPTSFLIVIVAFVSHAPATLARDLAPFANWMCTTDCFQLNTKRFAQIALWSLGWEILRLGRLVKGIDIAFRIDITRCRFGYSDGTR